MGDGRVQLPASAASRLRQLQELRGSVPRRLHGWQRCGHAWKDHQLRAEGRWRCWWQEEVSESAYSFVLCNRFAVSSSSLTPLCVFSRRPQTRWLGSVSSRKIHHL